MIGAVLGASVLASNTSCKGDFLDEDLTTKYSTQYFETAEGLEALAASLYGNIRWHFGYEWAYGITLYGTDEFTNANDLTSEPWNTYDTRLSPMNATPALGAANKNCPAVDALWNQMYYGIASCNTIIAGQSLPRSCLFPPWLQLLPTHRSVWWRSVADHSSQRRSAQFHPFFRS